MRRPRASMVAVVAVMLQLAAGLAAAAQVVVCRTPGGHVAIESELSDCCPAGGDRLHELAADGCDGCVDTPLFQAGLSPAGKAALAVLTASAWSVPAPAGFTAVRLSPVLPSGGTRPGRTVVLLI